MNPIRVFLVDDSVVILRLVTKALEWDPTIKVVGTASNGQVALPQIDALRPDVVILDVDMPVMDGIQTLVALRAAGQRVAVIMFSVNTQRGAIVTLDALCQGASDYLPKPVTSDGVGQTLDYFRTELIPKIKALAPAPPAEKVDGQPGVPVRSVTPGRSGEHRLGPSISGEVVRSPTSRSGEQRPGPPASGAVARPTPSVGVPLPSPRSVYGGGPTLPGGRWVGPPLPVGVVVIGVSTGGPVALAALLPLLPPGLPVPVLIVLHMPPIFTQVLAKSLAASCSFPVVEATADEPISPGQVYLAPGGYHMTVTPGRRIGLNQDPQENFCRPAVDVLFRSVAREYGSAVLAIILTGMGNDGTKGCEVIRKAGGQVLAQDEGTSLVWGMPGMVVKAGLADEVLPLGQIAATIVRRVRAGRSAVAT